MFQANQPNLSTLYKVLCTTIDSLYGQNLACSFQANAVDTVALVYKIENQLSEWQRGLPSHMRLIVPQDMPERLPPAETSTDEAWRPIRLRFILTLRYTNVRILLHRPVLVKFLEGLSSPGDTNDFSLLQQMGAIHIQIATKSAKEIISLVLNALQSATGRSKWGLLGAWWFTLYYSTLSHCSIACAIHISHHCFYSVQRSPCFRCLRISSRRSKSLSR